MEEAEHGKCGEELFHRHTELFIPYQHLFAWISGSRSAFWIIPARFRRWLRVHRGKRVTIHSRQPPTRPRMLGPSLQKAEAPVRQPPIPPEEAGPRGGEGAVPVRQPRPRPRLGGIPVVEAGTPRVPPSTTGIAATRSGTGPNQTGTTATQIGTAPSWGGTPAHPTGTAPSRTGTPPSRTRRPASRRGTAPSWRGTSHKLS